MEELSETPTSSGHTESEGPCLIVQDSQKDEHPPGTSHKQKMLWEMTALQGDQHISPVLEQVRSASLGKDVGKKKITGEDPEGEAHVAATTTTTSPAPTTEAPPWTITKMPSVPPRHKESHSSSSSSMGSVYPLSSQHTSSSSRSSLVSSDSSGVGRKTSPNTGQGKSVSSKAKHKKTVTQGQVKLPSGHTDKTSDIIDISSSQEDMFSDPKVEAGEMPRHSLLGSPSETISSLQLSGQMVYANETSTSDGSVNVIQPSPEAWGPIPVIIPSTPTPEASVEEEEPMEMSLEDAEDEPQMMQEELVIGDSQQVSDAHQDEGQQVMEHKKMSSHSGKRSRSAGSGSEEDEIRIPEWQQALNREEEAAAAAAAASGDSRTSSRVSIETHSSQRSSQSDQWAQQSESIAGQDVQQVVTTNEESARSRPSSSIKSPVPQAGVPAPDKEVITGAQMQSGEKAAKSMKSKDLAVNIEPSEPQFSQDLFHPEVPIDTGVSATPEEAAEITHEPSTQENLARRSEARLESQPQESQPQSQQDNQGRSEKPTSDDWSLHLTPTQSETQSQGMYLSRKVPSSQSGKETHKEQTSAKDIQTEQVEHSVHTADRTASNSQQRSVQPSDKQAVGIESEMQTPEAHRPSDGQSVGSERASGQWDESIQSAPRQSQSIDPSQLSSNGFHLSVPADSGLRPVTSVTPPVDMRKKGRTSRQPRHSTPLVEESTEKDQGDTPTGVKGQQTSTLTLEEGIESELQESNDLPRFHLAKPSDTEQLVKTAKESPSKRSTSVFSRVQETKIAAVPRRTRKQLHSNRGNTGESEDPFALPSNVTRSADSRHEPETNTGTESVRRPEREQDVGESVIDLELEPVKSPEAEKAPGNQEVEDTEATIPMVYDEDGKAQRDTIQEMEGKPQEEEQTQKTSKATSQKRGKKGRGKKRKKPTQRFKDNEASRNQQQDANSSIEHPAKQPCVERDPYEWTESQSNKTPTPLKLRKGTASETAGVLPRRRLHEQEREHSAGVMELGSNIDVTAGSSRGARKSAGGNDSRKEGKENAPMDTTPDKEMGQGPSRSPGQQQTPPVDGGGDDADDSQDSERSSQGATQDEVVRRQIITTIVKTTFTQRIIKETIYKGDKLVDVNVQQIQDAPVVQRFVEEHFSPSLGSSNSSLTSGSLADISSFSTTKSSSESPSLQKTSSSSSGGSNLTKMSSISSISRVDSSLGKTVSSSTSPSSNKTSPNTSKGSGTPGTPKMARSVSFQDEQPGHKSPSREATSKSAGTSPVIEETAQRSALTRAHTVLLTPTEQPSESSRLTRSRTDAISPKQGESSSKEKAGQKSIFAKTYSTPGKRGLRARGTGDVPEREERESRTELRAEKTVKDAEKEEGHRKGPQKRLRRSRSGQKSGEKSLTDDPKEPSVPTTLPATLPTEPSSVQSEQSRSRSETTGQSSSLSEVRSSERSKSSSSRGAEILGTPPHDPESPGTDVSRRQLRPGTRVLAKWLDSYFYAGKILEPSTDNKYVVIFDDGDTRNINERDIIIKEWLSKGQSVLAAKEDGYSYAGVVVGYYNDADTGEQGYAIETDLDHETQRYTRGKVILTRDQAATLVVSGSSSGPGSATSSSEINLDNIVSGKRTRTPGRQTAKRKLIPSAAGRSSTPSPKRAKGIKAAVSPDLTVSPRRSPRKNPAAASTSSHVERIDRDSEMGPLPSNKSLFKGLAFLITSCSERKKRRITGRSPSESTDESGLEEEGETVPLDKMYAAEQVQHGGGIVLTNFDKSQITKCKVYLLSNACARTTKYFQALAAGIPCISHLWLRDCVRSNKIQEYAAYQLPAGIGLDDKSVLEQQLQRCILAGMHIFVVSRQSENQKAWRSILIAAGCEVVKKLPTNLMRRNEPPVAFECEVIVTDHTCPKHVLDRALQLHIPVVSAEWLLQSLINSRRFPYDHSHKFTWDWKESQ